MQDGSVPVGITGTLTGNPVIGVLRDNGGPTPTHALSLFSPAVNAGFNSVAVDQFGNPLATDQTGRPRFVGTRVDIGSFESSFVDQDPVPTPGPPPDGTSAGSSPATLTLVSGVTAAEGSGGGTVDFSFTVRLERAGVGAFNVAYTTSDGNATLGDGDYIGSTGTLAFSGIAGESRTITVRVNRDAKVEDDEFFGVSLGAISGLSAGIDPARLSIRDNPQIGTILNDDTTQITIQNLGVLGNTIEFAVISSNAVQGPFEIDFSTADDTAIATNGDYTPASGTLMFSGTAGEERHFFVDVNPGTVPKSFLMNLSPVRASGVDAGNVNVETATLLVPIPVFEISTLTLASVAATRSEGTGSGTTAFTFSVTLDKAISGGFTLAYTTTDGTATLADGDYMNNDGNLIFAGTAGEVQTITVLVNHDSKVEADEVFSVFFGSDLHASAGFRPVPIGRSRQSADGEHPQR